MRALIFGASGQDGYYLSKRLEQEGITCIMVSKSGKVGLQGDVADYEFVRALIEKEQPEYIFDFAAISSTRHDVLFENHDTISTGTLNILESVRVYCPNARVFLSGSAMQFRNEGVPINEQTPFEARSPYAVSRIHSVYAGRYYRSQWGLRVYVGYLFNHDSPLRTEHHMNKKIVEAVKRIIAGSDEYIEIGDIEVKKEFNFAGDIVEAIWILVNQDHVHEVVIGSGMAYSIKDFVRYCFQKTGKDWSQYIRGNHAYVPEYQVLVSDPHLMFSLGWKPKMGFEELADMMLEEV